MPLYPTRRVFLAITGASLALTLMGVPEARAQSTADAFLTRFASQLIHVVDGPEDYATRKAALAPIIDRDVAVDKIGRFCLGRFYASATPAQQADYLKVFHQVLLRNIAGKIGAYKGTTYKLTGDQPQGSNTIVGSIITRPGAPPANVQWVVDTSSGSPKIVDVIAEGTSLRLTSRSDYASFLVHHGNNIQALIDALRAQVASPD